MSYIDNFEIQPKNDTAATLLSLELKKKIGLAGDKIKIENSNVEEISSNEKYVLESINDGKINNFNENEFIEKVKEDAVKNGLLKESKFEWKKVARILIISAIFMILMICICVMLVKDVVTNNPTDTADWKLFIMAMSILLVLDFPIFIAIYLYTYIRKSKKNNCIRTSKGKEVNERLEGLKNYLKDFSIMNERDEKSLAIWEDYLIYSVIFNQNSKIVKNIYDKYILL